MGMNDVIICYYFSTYELCHHALRVNLSLRQKLSTQPLVDSLLLCVGGPFWGARDIGVSWAVTGNKVTAQLLTSFCCRVRFKAFYAICVNTTNSRQKLCSLAVEVSHRLLAGFIC